MPFPLFGIAGGALATRLGFAGATAGATFLRSPIIQGGSFGVGYTGGAYAGYGLSNTWDPLRLHQTYKHPQARQFRMPYGSYGYGRRRYRRRYGSYGRYGRRSRYGYRRRSYYRRSYY